MSLKGDSLSVLEGQPDEFQSHLQTAPPQARCIDTMGLQKHLVQESKGHSQGELSQLVQHQHHLSP